MAAGRLKITQVSGMQKVENTVCEDDGFAVAAGAGHKCREIVDAEYCHLT